jgi:pilus assembly protein CpaF
VTGRVVAAAAASPWRSDVAERAGVLAPLLDDPAVTDILVNGPGAVWVDRGDGITDSGVRIGDEGAVRALAQRLVVGAGRRLDDAQPYADARLPDGTRVHAVLPPIAPDGTALSLRIPPRRAFRLGDLVARDAVPPPGAELLRAVVRSRLAFLVTGGTGTGKTTVLSTLLSEVPHHHRIVLVEDAAELRPSHPHVVRLESRLSNAEGAGGIPLDVLVRQALRMRPDRLVVGEARGREVADLLNALNTGHEGGCATLHAGRSEHVPARVEALAAQAGLSRESAHAQLLAAVQVVVHLRRETDGRRRVAGIGIVQATRDGLATVTTAYAFRGGDAVAGPAAADLDEWLGRC